MSCWIISVCSVKLQKNRQDLVFLDKPNSHGPGRSRYQYACLQFRTSKHLISFCSHFPKPWCKNNTYLFVLPTALGESVILKSFENPGERHSSHHITHYYCILKGTEIILIESKAFCLSERTQYQGSPQQSEMIPSLFITVFVFNGEPGQGCTFGPSISPGARHISFHSQWTLLLAHCLDTTTAP